MANLHEAQPASVIIDYQSDDHLTTAHFVWQEGEPQDTYTIDVSSGVSFGLDTQLPVRPHVIHLYDKSIQRVEPLVELVGEELTGAMLGAQKLGTLALSITLSGANRLAIARLQFKSPSTPPRLRDATAVFLDAHSDNPRLASHRHVVDLSRRAG